MVETVYKRGQVEWALWRYMTYLLPGGSPALLPEFRTRIKRLLELDAQRDSSKVSKVPHARYAFFEGRPGGKGTDVSYTHFNAVCLAWGLELLDVGFKQWEIVFLLRHLREPLHHTFQYILQNPPEPRQKITPNERPDCPVYHDEKGGDYPDCRVYMVLQKVEFPYMNPRLKKRKRAELPVFPTPVFCRGYLAVAEELHRMNRKDYTYHKAFVMELAHAVVLVQNYLQEAPEFTRGRK